MIYGVYSVHDHVAACYSSPQIYPNDGVAVRAFRLMCGDENMPFVHSPNDYTFEKIGSMDVDNGVIESNSQVIIARAVEFCRKEND